jgi:RND family efflux transporter MFP subunit
MRNFLLPAARVVITLIIVAAALVAGDRLWSRYQLDPWTRDGRIRADVVQVAPDVAGLVSSVAVSRDQTVKRGDVLFVIDQARYTLALQQAEAAVAAQKATLEEARKEVARNRGIRDLVAHELSEQTEARAASAAAAMDQAVVARNIAALNLERTVVRAPIDGLLSDLTLRTGDYVSPGKPVLALIDSGSFRIEGYFEETKLPRMRIGQAVEVKIMGEHDLVRGHIQSIAPGIEDRERQRGSNLLPNVNPTFSWVRLAQRVPVRIAIDEVPKNVRLISGRTATVTVLENSPRARGGS